MPRIRRTSTRRDPDDIRSRRNGCHARSDHSAHLSQLHAVHRCRATRTAFPSRPSQSRPEPSCTRTAGTCNVQGQNPFSRLNITHQSPTPKKYSGFLCVLDCNFSVVARSDTSQIDRHRRPPTSPAALHKPQLRNHLCSRQVDISCSRCVAASSGGTSGARYLTEKRPSRVTWLRPNQVFIGRTVRLGVVSRVRCMPWRGGVR